MLKQVRASSILATTIAVAVSGASASAQPINDRAIVVQAPGKAKLDVNQRAVEFRDLALDGRAGHKELLRRVAFAVNSLCDDSGASTNPVEALKCSNQAWDAVRPELDQLLRR